MTITQANTPLNIAVIGAGIMGLMSTRALAKQGHNVTLYNREGFPPTCSASAIAGGMLTPYSEIDHMTPAFVEAGVKSIALWQDFIQHDAPAVPFLQEGSLLLAHQEDAHMLDRFRAHLQTLDPGTWQHLNRQELQDKIPALPAKFTRALFLPQEGSIYPLKVIEALTKQFEDSPSILLRPESALPGALKESYDFVIDCRGVGAIAGTPDLRGIKGEIAIVRNPEFSAVQNIRIMHPRYPLYIVPRPDHVFMIGATQIETNADHHEEPLSVRSSMELLSCLYALHPSFAEAKVLSFHSGVRPAYPDNLPRISQHENVITCNGMYRHGFLLSPIMAEDVVTLVSGGQARSPFLHASNQKAAA